MTTEITGDAYIDGLNTLKNEVLRIEEERKQVADRIDLETFMREEKPNGDRGGRRSYLDLYETEIKTLRKNKYTMEQIIRYMKLAFGLDVKPATLSSFLNRKGIKKSNATRAKRIPQ